MARVTRNVLFREGQIVRHLRYAYRGVVVGYDRTCQADDAWYDFQTRGKGYRPTRDQPWYHVLVDGSVRPDIRGAAEPGGRRLDSTD